MVSAAISASRQAPGSWRIDSVETFADCATAVKFGGDPLAAIMNAPTVRCDEAQWSIFGISLAGFNFVISCAAAGVIFALLARASRSAA